jgi:DNA processing protein
MEDTDLARLVALTDIDGVGPKRARAIYDAFDSASDIYKGSANRFDEFHYIDNSDLNRLQESRDKIRAYESRFEHCRNKGIDVIGLYDARYPESLRQHHAPLVLYTRGNSSLLEQPSISFAGSRDTDTEGREWAHRIAKNLTGEYVIVSGGALGVDTAAHEGALAGDGETIVVLGTGIENWYPEENEHLFKQILDAGGLLVSHRAPDAGPARHGFLQRNKTNAALGEAIIIVATDGSGGTMSQYRDATSLGTPVLVPSPSYGHSPTEGIEQIINNGTVTVVDSADDINSVAISERYHSESSSNQATLDDWGEN